MEVTPPRRGEKGLKWQYATVATVALNGRFPSNKHLANVRVVDFNPNNENANVNNDNPNNQNDNRGAVRVIKGYWLCVAFNHPPSILPIS